MKRIGILACAGTALALATGGLLWSVRPKPGPQSDRRVAVWKAAPTRVERLARDPESCTFTDRIELEKQRRVGAGEGDGVAAVCKYVMHLDGWPEGEDECVLEFPVDGVRDVRATTAGASLAVAYYWHRQGGLMFHRSPTPHRTFITLDARWCRWDSVTEGLRVIP